jgi:hypothetical protein
MGLFSFLTANRSGGRVNRLAQEIARRSHAAVWNRVERRAATMRLAEVRGYVRARAAQVIHDQADQVLRGQGPIAESLRPQLIAQATERVVSLIVRDLLNLPARFWSARQAA